MHATNTNGWSRSANVGGEDLNERIVREGWGLDFRKYSSDYLRAEAEAKRAGAGSWREEFTPPGQRPLALPDCLLFLLCKDIL